MSEPYCEAQVGGMECGRPTEKWGQQCKYHDPPKSEPTNSIDSKDPETFEHMLTVLMGMFGDARERAMDNPKRQEEIEVEAFEYAKSWLKEHDAPSHQPNSIDSELEEMLALFIERQRRLEWHINQKHRKDNDQRIKVLEQSTQTNRRATLQAIKALYSNSDLELARLRGYEQAVEALRKNYVSHKEVKEVMNLFGRPVCEHLHHPKKYQHRSYEICPVVEHIVTLRAKLLPPTKGGNDE